MWCRLGSNLDSPSFAQRIASATLPNQVLEMDVAPRFAGKKNIAATINPPPTSAAPQAQLRATDPS